MISVYNSITLKFLIMKKLNFAQFALTGKELKTIKGGDVITVPVSTTTQTIDFNSSRSNRERGN